MDHVSRPFKRAPTPVYWDGGINHTIINGLCQDTRYFKFNNYQKIHAVKALFRETREIFSGRNVKTFFEKLAKLGGKKNA